MEIASKIMPGEVAKSSGIPSFTFSMLFMSQLTGLAHYSLLHRHYTPAARGAQIPHPPMPVSACLHVGAHVDA